MRLGTRATGSRLHGTRNAGSRTLIDARAGGGFDVESLFAGTTGEWWLGTDPNAVFSDSAGTTPAAINDPVGRWKGQRGLFNLTEANTGSKPIFLGNAVKFFNGKGYNCGGFTLQDGTTDWTWFTYGRRTSTLWSTDMPLIRTLRASGHILHGLAPYPYSPATGATLFNRLGGGGYQMPPFGAVTDNRGVFMDYPIDGAQPYACYYNDGTANQVNTGANPTSLGDTNPSATIQVGFDSQFNPAWEVKLILGIAKILSADERAALYAYCTGLP